MSVVSTAQATWSGTLAEGAGTTTLVSSGLGTFNTNWKARAEGAASTTTPEELLGAAHAACYSMAMSHELAGQGFAATSIDVTANVTFVPGQGITGVALTVVASIPGFEPDAFAALAEAVKAACPVSQALSGTSVTLASATLV